MAYEEEDLKTIGIRNWRRSAGTRGEWRKSKGKGKIHPGLYNQKKKNIMKLSSSQKYEKMAKTRFVAS